MEEIVYDIEKVIRCRNKKGKKEYLVKWKGWPSKYNSWEPESNLVDVDADLATSTETSSYNPLKTFVDALHAKGDLECIIREICSRSDRNGRTRITFGTFMRGEKNSVATSLNAVDDESDDQVFEFIKDKTFENQRVGQFLLNRQHGTDNHGVNDTIEIVAHIMQLFKETQKNSLPVSGSSSSGTAGKTLPDTTGESSSPGTTGETSSPGTSEETSLPDISEETSSSGTAGESSSLPDLAEETSLPDTAEKSLPDPREETSLPDHTEETSSTDTGEKSLPDPPEEISLPDTTGVNSLPDTARETSLPDPAEETSLPDTAEKSLMDRPEETTLPDTTEATSLPDPAEETSPPDTGEKSLPDPREETSLPDHTEETSSTDTGEKSLPDPPEEISLPDTTGVNSLPDTARETSLPDPAEETSLPDPAEETSSSDTAGETSLPDPAQELLTKARAKILKQHRYILNLLTLQLKTSLSMKNPDIKKCIHILTEVENIVITPEMMESNIDLISTIKKLRSFKFSDHVCQKATHIFNKLKSTFYDNERGADVMHTGALEVINIIEAGDEAMEYSGDEQEVSKQSRGEGIEQLASKVKREATEGSMEKEPDDHGVVSFCLFCNHTFTSTDDLDEHVEKCPYGYGGNGTGLEDDVGMMEFADILTGLDQEKISLIAGNSSTTAEKQKGEEEVTSTTPTKQKGKKRKSSSHMKELKEKKKRSSPTKRMIIHSSKAPSRPGKRVWDKVHYCKYCNQGRKKLVEHWEDKHDTEADVCRILSMKKGSKKRREAIGNLKKEGDYMHNTLVLKGEIKGELVVHKRPDWGDKKSMKVYTYCSDCLGMYKKKSLYRHKKVCRKRKKKNKTGENQRHQRAGAALMPLNIKVSKKLGKILAGMEQDKIALIVRNDDFICKLGEYYVQKAGHTPSCKPYVSQKMREAARLLEITREVAEDVSCAKDLINPRNFDSVVEATLQLAGFDEDSQKFKTPTLARKVGHTLNRMTEIIDADALKQGLTSSEEQEAAKGFKRLMDIEWATRVSSHSLRQASDNKWENPDSLPVNSDIMKLNKHMLTKSDKVKKEIKSVGINKQNYSHLAKVTLAQVITYNRRRPGETQFLKVDNYHRKLSKGANAHKDVLEALPLSEQLSIQRLSCVYIRGKKDRGVPLLLTDQMKESMDILASRRADAGVHRCNPYLFARCYQDSCEPLRGHDCLREFAKSSGANCPEDITATKLRKHVATMSQLLDLKDNELEQLATHLGHNIAVHREFYRLPQEVLILGKVGKMLHALENGSLQNYTSLADISVEHDPQTVETPTKKVQRLRKPWTEEEEAAIQNHTGLNESLLKQTVETPTEKVQRLRKPWTEEEEAAIQNHTGLNESLLKLQTPNVGICKDAKEKCPCLRDRSIVQIKSKISNMIKKAKKHCDEEVNFMAD